MLDLLLPFVESRDPAPEGGSALARRRQVVAEIAESYYELLALDTQMAILKPMIEVQQSPLRTVTLQKDAGKVTDGDKIVVLSSAQGEHQPGRTDSIYVHTVGACD